MVGSYLENMDIFFHICELTKEKKILFLLLRSSHPERNKWKEKMLKQAKPTNNFLP